MYIVKSLEEQVEDLTKNNLELIHKNEELQNKFEMVSEFFEATANFICDTFDAHTLMKLAVENGFSKKECLKWFIDDEGLYNRVVEEVASEE